MEAAVAICSTRYRSHWGAELALQGARLRFSRAYLAAQDPTCQAGMTFGTSSIGLDPADSAQYAAEAAPILGGPPSGQDRYYSLLAAAALCGCSVSFFGSLHSTVPLPYITFFLTYPGHSAGLQRWVPLPLHIVRCVKADKRGPKGHTGLAGWGLEGQVCPGEPEVCSLQGQFSSPMAAVPS